MTGPQGIHFIIERVAGTDTYHRIHTDFQGSIMSTKDLTANTTTAYNYDAWGRRRNASTWDYGVTATGPSWLNRGYTGHEHLDDFQLINMNGRLFDPLIGRMLSPDNYVQLPYATQGYNRYTYALNNPMRYTDPSGEIIPQLLLGAAIGVIVNGVSNSIQHKAFFSGAGRAAAFGAIGGAVSGGIGWVADQAVQSGIGDQRKAQRQTICIPTRSL